jgi:hypothetical protein
MDTASHATVRYRRSPSAESAPLQAETIVYDSGAKRFCMLNPTAAFMWDHLNEPRTVQELAEAVRSSFAVADTACVEDDVRAVLAQFASHALVVAD